MKIENLIPHIVSGDTFIGLKLLDNKIHFYYPETYHFDPDNYERNDFLDLLLTVGIAKSFSDGNAETEASRINGNELALLSYIWIIEDFMKNGFIFNKERTKKINQKGKVNWKRTFMQQPLISDGNVIYKDIVVEIDKPSFTTLTEAHKFCIKKSLMLLGWIYGLSAKMIEIPNNPELQTDKYLFAIREELNLTFDDDEQKRLKHMENVILGLDELTDMDNVIYGVNSYHYIFEQMINYIFGTEKVSDYYPSFYWNLEFSMDKNLSGPTIRPDTIMKDLARNEIYIIDSKFYRYGIQNLSQTKGLPEASSIIKQVTYGSYVQNKYPDAKVFNIFLLPYDSMSQNGKQIDNNNPQKIVYVGNVSSDWDNNKTYGKIYTFLVDLRFVVKCWNRIDHSEERNMLLNLMHKVLVV